MDTLDVSLNVDEIHMILKSINTELVTNNEMATEEQKLNRLKLVLLYDKLEVIEKMLMVLE